MEFHCEQLNAPAGDSAWWKMGGFDGVAGVAVGPMAPGPNNAKKKQFQGSKFQPPNVVQLPTSNFRLEHLSRLTVVLFVDSCL